MGWFDEIAADTILVFVSSSSLFLRKRSECPNNNFRRVDRCDNRSEQRGRARRGCRVEGQRQGRNTISEKAENGDVSATMNQKQVSELPNPGNDLTYIVQTAPGVVMNTDVQGGANFSILGMPGFSLSSYHRWHE